MSQPPPNPPIRVLQDLPLRHDVALIRDEPRHSMLPPANPDPLPANCNPQPLPEPGNKKKAAFDPYAYSRAKLAARHAAEALEIQQSEQAAIESMRLNLDLAVIRGFLLRECRYDPTEGVDLSELRPQGPMPQRLPPMDVLARAVKFGVVTIMAGGVK